MKKKNVEGQASQLLAEPPVGSSVHLSRVEEVDPGVAGLFPRRGASDPKVCGGGTTPSRPRPEFSRSSLRRPGRSAYSIVRQLGVTFHLLVVTPEERIAPAPGTYADAAYLHVAQGDHVLRRCLGLDGGKGTGRGALADPQACPGYGRGEARCILERYRSRYACNHDAHRSPNLCVVLRDAALFVESIENLSEFHLKVHHRVHGDDHREETSLFLFSSI